MACLVNAGTGRPSLSQYVAAFLTTVAFLVSPPAHAAAQTDTQSSKRAPNILVLMAEDLSARAGAFGDPVARTPHLDRLAAAGTRFPNTFTAAGVCAPSRAAFITGVHQISLGAMHMRTSTSPVARYMAVPPPEVKAFPELLRQAGYLTFTDRKLDYQFSGVYAGSGPETIWDHEEPALRLDQAWPEFLANRPAGQPFFGHINFLVTHESATFLPEHTTSDGGRRVAAQIAAARAQLPARTDPAAVTVPPYYPDEPAVRETIADHYDNVQLMDAQVGGIMRSLAEHGELDNTIIVWTTDHGDALPRAKRELFDSGIKVPLIVRWPASLQPNHFQAGGSDERLLSFVDMAPTLLAFAGLSPQPFHQGRDRLSANAAQRTYVYASRDRMDEQRDRVRAVRDHRFKYLRYFHPDTPGAFHLDYRDQGRIMQSLWRHHEAGTLSPAAADWFEPRPDEALYDLNADPHELNNLAQDPEHLATLTRMRMAYAQWRLGIPDLADEEEADLAERFWPGGEQPQTPAPRFATQANGSLLVVGAEGASIEINSGAGWRLYDGAAIEANAAGALLRARAVRYGHSLSDEARYPAASGTGDSVIASPGER
jgi:arylsulfatase A-like enzyme